jgi:hypothetical protein
VKDDQAPGKGHVISRRGFLGAVAAIAGTAAVAKPERQDPPDPRLLRPKVRWIGHL